MLNYQRVNLVKHKPFRQSPVAVTSRTSRPSSGSSFTMCHPLNRSSYPRNSGGILRPKYKLVGGFNPYENISQLGL